MSLTMAPSVGITLPGGDRAADVQTLCGRWIMKHKQFSVQPGTTFPPFAQDLPYFQKKLQALSQEESKLKCHSEPYLNNAYSKESSVADEEPELHHDEDYLFEFDIGSPAESEGESEADTVEFEAPSAKFVNVIEGEGLLFDSSDTGSSCGHKKEVSGDGFSTIFGSSGFGSQRTSVTSCRRGSLPGSDAEWDCVQLEGLSLEPGDWRAAATTPILSPALPTAGSPTVSPDSCIEEESLLEANLCIECATSTTLQLVERVDGVGAGSRPQSQVRLEVIEESQSEGAVIKESTDVNRPGVTMEQVEINTDLLVSTEKLNTLLSKFETDKFFSIEDPNCSEDTSSSQEDLNLLTIEAERRKLRKSSSLKTNRTPPTTPGHQKIVRFADILGLDLSEVKVFSDEIPRVPKRAFDDLEVNLSDFEIGSPIPKSSYLPAQHRMLPPVETTSLVPMFNQPGGSADFYDTVAVRKVCLENAFMEGPRVVFGVVRVVNLSFHKAVTVRWTVDGWASVSETECDYVVGSNCGDTDKFSFKLVTPDLSVGGRLQFCLKYECGAEFWDNNSGANYVFQVFPNSRGSCGGSKQIAVPTSSGVRSAARPFRGGLQLHSVTSPSQHGDDPWLRFM